MKQEEINKLATVIKWIQMLLREFDPDDVDDIGDRFLAKADRYDTMAALLYHKYNPDKSKLWAKEGEAIKALASFLRLNEEISSIKEHVDKERDLYEEIEKMFEI